MVDGVGGLEIMNWGVEEVGWRGRIGHGGGWRVRGKRGDVEVDMGVWMRMRARVREIDIAIEICYI